MAKMSQTVKEILQIVVFLLIVGILVTVFIIYPLNRTKAFFARPDIEEFNADSLPANDPTAFLELGAVVDTFRVDADGLTSLACIYLTPQADSATPNEPVVIRGTAILLHDERADRNSMIPLATTLLDSGFEVCLYDQRASGLSTGEYHGDGEFEATDLAELIGYLGIRDRIHHPLVAIGQSVGADAVLLIAADEPRLDAVVAIEPYVTSERWLDMLMDEHDMYWLPFSHTLLEFWYELQSGYAPQYRERDDLDGVDCRALILVSEDHLDDEEIATVSELSGTGLVETKLLPDDSAEVINQVMQFVITIVNQPTDQEPTSNLNN